jgi:hypothetical protein
MERVFFTRIAALAVGGGAAWWGVRHQKKVVETLREYFFTPTAPESLALARIFIFGVFLRHAIESPAVWYTQIPDYFRRLRMGWEWLENALPAIYSALPAARLVLIATAALAVLGLGTRVVTVVASVLGVFVFAIPTMYFKVGHDLHGQVLVAMIIASAPCGDALSVDSWLRRRRGAPRFGRSVAYTIPMRFAWLVIGTMYLFPGLWKIWESGDLYMDGSAIQDNILAQYRNLPDFYPLFRVDHARLLLVVLGTATLVFETGYFFAMFHPTTRVIAALGIAGFHLGVGLTMEIWFDSFFPLLPLLDLPDILSGRRLRPLAMRVPWTRSLIETYPEMTDRGKYSMPRDSGAFPFLVGSLFVLGMFVAGLALINSFPIGVYPRFAGRGRHFDDPIPETSAVKEVFVRQADGQETRVPDEELLPMRRVTGMLIDTIVDSHRKKDRKRLRRFQALLGRIVRESKPALIKEGSNVVIYECTYLADPDARRNAEPTREELLNWEL